MSNPEWLPICPHCKRRVDQLIAWEDSETAVVHWLVYCHGQAVKAEQIEKDLWVCTSELGLIEGQKEFLQTKVDGIAKVTLADKSLAVLRRLRDSIPLFNRNGE